MQGTLRSSSKSSNGRRVQGFARLSRGPACKVGAELAGCWGGLFANPAMLPARSAQRRLERKGRDALPRSQSSRFNPVLDAHPTCAGPLAAPSSPLLPAVARLTSAR